MKAVLIPIQPLDCELISKRKKRVIITKRKSRLETPFKCYIYETRHGIRKCNNCNQKDDCYAYARGAGCYNGCSKVIGEFLCDKIEEFKKGEKGIMFQRFEALYETCLTVNEMRAYMGNSDKVYGWHISELKIYDEPKELSEFRVVDENAVIYCQYRERICVNPDFTNGAQLKGGYICAKDKITPHWCEKCLSKHITRAPRNWCYVEELE